MECSKCDAFFSLHKWDVWEKVCEIEREKQ